MQNSNDMNSKSRYAAFIVFSIAGILIVLGTYVRIWESRQPKQYIKKALVKSITPYFHSNDLHWSSRGFRVYIAGTGKPINFPSKIWEHTVHAGDFIDAVVSQNFPWFGLIDELQGLSVRVHERS